MMELDFVFLGVAYADDGSFPRVRVQVSLPLEATPAGLARPFIDLALPLDAASAASLPELRARALAAARAMLNAAPLRQWLDQQAAAAPAAG